VPVRCDVDGGLAEVTLDRPQGRNAFTLEMKTALLDVLGSVAADTTVRAVLLTANGPAFSVGQDLKEHLALAQAGDDGSRSTVAEHYNPLVTLLAEMPKPVVCALAATAAGAGLGLALACDFRIAAAGTRFTTAFTGVGLTADSGMSATLPRLVGLGRATELLLLAEPFTAEQALSWGMVTAVVPAEEVLPRARDLARRLAAGPTVAYASVKESLRIAATAPLAEVLAAEDRLQTVCGATADHAAGLAAFLNRERPQFRGR